MFGAKNVAISKVVVFYNYIEGKVFLGKFSRKCDMCKGYKMNGEFYKWVGIITKTELTICSKCAKREGILNAK